MSGISEIWDAKRNCIDWAGVILELEARYPHQVAAIDFACVAYEASFRRYTRLCGASSKIAKDRHKRDIVDVAKSNQRSGDHVA